MLTPPVASQQGEGGSHGAAGTAQGPWAATDTTEPQSALITQPRCLWLRQGINPKFLPQGQHRRKLNSQESWLCLPCAGETRGGHFPAANPVALQHSGSGAWHRTQFTWKGCGALNTRSRWIAGRAELVCLAALLKISSCASLEGGRVPFLHSGSEIKPLQLGLAMQCPTPRVLWAAPAGATHFLKEPGKAGDAVVCTSSILGILQLPWKPKMLTVLPERGVSLGPVPVEECDGRRAQGCRRETGCP